MTDRHHPAPASPPPTGAGGPVRPGGLRLPGRPHRGGRRPARLLVLGLLALALPAAPAPAKVFLTQEQALTLAFGEGAAPRRQTAYLTDAQAEAIEERGGSEPGSRVVVTYRGEAPGGGTRAAYFDTHLVRTLPETVMVVVDGDGRVVRVDVLTFDEPEDYLPSRRWLDQFNGKPLDDELSTRRSIRAVTGATLSSRAVTATVRRVLATHHVLNAAGPAAGDGEEAP